MDGGSTSPSIWLIISASSGPGGPDMPAPVTLIAPLRPGSRTCAAMARLPQGVESSVSSARLSKVNRPIISAWSVTAMKSSGRRICTLRSSPGCSIGMPRA